MYIINNTNLFIAALSVPGPPASMTVSPEEELGVENGSAPTFTVSVFDIADNLTCDGKLVVTAKVEYFSAASSCVVTII